MRLLPFAVLLAVAESAGAQDTVRLSNSTAAEGYVSVTGTVVDFSGAGVSVESAGSTRTYPIRLVQSIETHHTQSQLQGDAHYKAGKFTEALVAYRTARTEETRSWVRREITARIVWCYRALGQTTSAAHEFLLLVRTDPATPYYDCIPLAWQGSFQSRTMIPEAQAWLRQEDLPAAVLLGASFLLQTEHGTTALTKLHGLAKSADENVALLARAQAWRPTVISAQASQVQQWQEMVEAMPAPLRTGPYYIVGQGWARCQEWEKAAFALVRIPVLYPEHRELASQALFDAAAALGKLNRHDEANRLYGELIKDHPQSPLVAEAQSRLKVLPP
ncbi:MAG: tetratricopeptide repeat protein [Planctomycetaceae bacterium]|nr:tetratricopeptide repeat protein [Planctomycetaceae bacterium]